MTIAKPTLVILAAGMASRYGSMKQTQGFGPSGETIMEYSIYDAIKAGFTKVVFIIREDFAESFKAALEPKLNGRIETTYVYQALNSYTNGFEVPIERAKPWGTGHALLCTKDAVTTPFVIINADDFYGAEAFATAAKFFSTTESNDGALVAFQLGKTLSENGSVSRGVCVAGENLNLVSVTERTKIYKTDSGIVYEEGERQFPLEKNAPVSMNFWCFRPNIYAVTEQLFAEFLQAQGNELKSEFYMNAVVEAMIKNNIANFKVLQSAAQWVGVTYKEDAPAVQTAIDNLILNGSYPKNLWAS
jgi:UTP-glucose-1-phosphate uridylyltransferase